VHGYEYYQKAASFRTRLEQLMLRRSFRFINEQADHIFSYGGNISDIIRKNIKNSGTKIIEIPTGIEREFLYTDTLRINSPRQFAFLGRCERRKGIEELTRAIKDLIGSQDFQFHFIGAIPANRRILSPKIIYHGILDDKDKIKSILQKSDVLICPSYAEGMPNVILEGMASGCAIIASDVGAVKVEVNTKNGWLIRPGSVVAIKDAIVEAVGIEDDLLLGMMKISITRVEKEFLWENVINGLIAALHKIIIK
jgi:glycosyltransferase involved in cell wall biosynthesis